MHVYLKIVLKSDYTRKDGTQNIRLRLTVNSRVKYFPLNIFVLPKNFKNGKVKTGDAMSSSKNLLIDKELNKANKIFFDYRINDISLTFDNFGRDYNNDVWGSDSFYDFVDLLRENLKGKLTPGSLKGYKDQANKLKSFRSKLIFKNIDRKFVQDYEKYLIITKKNKRSTINKSLKFIKSVLNRAVVDGLIKENIFDTIPIGRTDGNREFLTMDELSDLSNLYYEGSLKKNKANVLRYFLFSCYTGLRYSDIKKLRFNDIQDEKYISIQMQKTKENVLIPLTSKAKQLMPTKGFEAQPVFNVLHDQPTNRYLKDIMKVVEINKSISFHCSRHTFATLSKSLGMEYDVISKILGHTDIKTTKIYAKYELSHLEEEMKKWGSVQ